MMCIRPIRHQDLPALLTLASKTGKGLTTLQTDQSFLLKRIKLSEYAFEHAAQYADGSFLFALEDTDSGQVVGISGIESAVGLMDPWYNYRVGHHVHASRELDLYHNNTLLFLSNDLTGKSEICSLFLDADYRKKANGSLLSKSRFLFMADFAFLFDDVVMAEMRGVSDDQGISPFWESLGRHFFEMNFEQADFLTAVGQKTFVAELMPKFPIYTAFLTQQAQQVIGQVHPSTEPARAILEKEGFQYLGYIDIFDAGPALEVKRDQIASIRLSDVKPVRIVRTMTGAEKYLVSNRLQSEFRCALVDHDPTRDCVEMSEAFARQLHVDAGQSVRIAPLVIQ